MLPPETPRKMLKDCYQIRKRKPKVELDINSGISIRDSWYCKTIRGAVGLLGKRQAFELMKRLVKIFYVEAIEEVEDSVGFVKVVVYDVD